MKFPSYMREAVGFLYASAAKRREPIGTAFFTHVSEGDLVFTYIVTCAHVVRDSLQMGKRVVIRLNKAEQQGFDFIDLPLKGWHFHNDDSVDLAVYELPSDIRTEPYRAVVPEFNEWKLTAKRLAPGHYIGEGDEVAFIGLYDFISGERRNTPIFRSGRIALVADAPIQSKALPKPAILHVVECFADPLNSGSPLMIQGYSYRGQPAAFLFGVVAAASLERGIAFAVPVVELDEIINGEKLMKRRDAAVQEAKRERDDVVLLSAAPDFTSKDMKDALKKVARRHLPKTSTPAKASRRT